MSDIPIEQRSQPPMGGVEIFQEQVETVPVKRTEQLRHFATASDWMIRELRPYVEMDGFDISHLSDEASRAIEERMKSVPKNVQNAFTFFRDNPSLMPEQRRGRVSIRFVDESGWVSVESDSQSMKPAKIYLSAIQKAILRASQQADLAGRRFDVGRVIEQDELEGITDDELGRAIRSMSAKFEVSGFGQVILKRKTATDQMFSFPSITLLPDAAVDEPLTTTLRDRASYPFTHRKYPASNPRTFTIRDYDSFELFRQLVAEAGFANDYANQGIFSLREIDSLLPGRGLGRPETIAKWYESLPEEVQSLIRLTGNKKGQRHRYKSDANSVDSWMSELEEHEVVIGGIFDLMPQDQVSFVRTVQDIEARELATTSQSNLGGLAIMTGSRLPATEQVGLYPERTIDFASSIVKKLRDHIETAGREHPSVVVKEVIQSMISEDPTLSTYINYDVISWERVITEVQPIIQSFLLLESQNPDLSQGLYETAVAKVTTILQSIEDEASKAREFKGIQEMIIVLGKLANAGALEGLEDEELKSTVATIFQGEDTLRRVIIGEVTKRLQAFAEENGFLVETGWHSSDGTRNFILTQEAKAELLRTARDKFGIKLDPTSFNTHTSSTKENPFGINLPLNIQGEI